MHSSNCNPERLLECTEFFPSKMNLGVLPPSNHSGTVSRPFFAIYSGIGKSMWKQKIPSHKCLALNVFPASSQG